MHLSVLLLRPWLRSEWPTWCSRTATACRHQVRRSHTHVVSPWQPGQSDSRLSLSFWSANKVTFPSPSPTREYFLTSHSDDIPLVPVYYQHSASHLVNSEWVYTRKLRCSLHCYMQEFSYVCACFFGFSPAGTCGTFPTQRDLDC